MLKDLKKIIEEWLINALKIRLLLNKLHAVHAYKTTCY